MCQSPGQLLATALGSAIHCLGGCGAAGTGPGWRAGITFPCRCLDSRVCLPTSPARTHQLPGVCGVGDPLAQLPAGRDKHSNASSVSPSAARPERNCHGRVACRQCCPQAAHGLLRRQDRMWAALVPTGETPAWAVLLGPRPGGGYGAEC